MKNIRHKVFETNSSSTHSISINENSNGILETIVPNEDGLIELFGGEFGWSWKKFNDSMTKANYCAVHSMNHNPSLKEMLTSVIKEHTGAKEVIYSLSDEYSNSNWSYIDHQSNGTAEEAFASEYKLKNFIFNSKSWLFTGNDNSYPPPNFYDVNDTEEYKFELSVEGCDTTSKMVNFPKEKNLQELIDVIMEYHPMCERSYDFFPNNGLEYKGNWEFDSIVQDTNEIIKRSSLEKINEGKIILFKTERLYDTTGERKFIGCRILKEKELNFTIKEI